MTSIKRVKLVDFQDDGRVGKVSTNWQSASQLHAGIFRNGIALKKASH
jgi:hypothetical protein